MEFEALSLRDRVAVVVGGTSGIGEVLALALAQAGAHVVASSRRADRVDAVAGRIEASGRTTLRVVSDVTDRSSLEACRDRVVAELGPVDILVNAAGRTRRGPTIDFSEADWHAIIDCNLTGTLRSCQVFGAGMLKRGYGRIINIASLSSYVAFQEVAAYGASKAGVVALTQSLAIEWGRHGVNVNAIAPGVFETDLNRDLLAGTDRGRELLQRTPLGRFGRVQELAGAAVFLASPAASFVNGEVLTVDGGFRASGVNR